MSRRPARGGALVAVLGLGLVGCSGSSAGSVGGLGSSVSSAGTSASTSSSPSATEVASPSPAGLDPVAFARRIEAALRRAGCVEQQVNMTSGGERLLSEVSTLDYRASGRQMRAVVVARGRTLEFIVQADGDVYLRGVLTRAPKSWVRLRPGGSDSVSRAFAAYAAQLRAVVRTDDVTRAERLVFTRGIVRTGSDTVLGDPVDVYRGEVDLPATIARGRLTKEQADAVRRMGVTEATAEYFVDRTGLVRRVEIRMGPVTELSNRRTSCGAKFAAPAGVLRPDQVALGGAATAG